MKTELCSALACKLARENLSSVASTPIVALEFGGDDDRYTKKSGFPEKVTQPHFRNYLYRYGAYPGYKDESANPVWQDGTMSELSRKAISPTKSKLVGRVGQTDFAIDERAMGDLQFARNPQAKEAHEWIWYNIKDPNIFGLKPPRRWNAAGIKKQPPRPFLNREDGHFLLNNSCTLVRLFLKPQLRRLQCYFLPKLPKLIHPVCYHPPVPRVHRASTIWTRPQMWVLPMPPWNFKRTLDEPEIEEMRVEECTQASKENSIRHYKRHKLSITKLRALHRMPRLATPLPPPVRIDYGLRVRREELRTVRKIKPTWEDPVLSFWIDDLPDIMDFILAEEKSRNATAKIRGLPLIEHPKSICQSCEFYGEHDNWT